MPAIGFICTDNQKTTFDACFNECRISGEHPAGRCMALRNLKLIAEQREWTGKPSCTQLLKGTREAYLEITTDYYIDPQDAIFRITGTKAHDTLDKFLGDNELGEIRLELEGITGSFDYYDENGNLFDTKTYGSYKVMKCLGLEQREVETGELYKSGVKKGQPRTKKETVQGEPDIQEQTLQLNLYRMMLEDAGLEVKDLFLDIAVRDGGTYLATGRGITKNAYLLPIPKVNNSEVLDYFMPKKNALLDALKAAEPPEACTIDENWNGRKCEAYCNVWESCSVGVEARKEKNRLLETEVS